MRAIVLLCLLHAAFASFRNPWNGPTKAPKSDYSSGCNVDQGSCGCCLILQKVNMLKMYFDETLAKLKKEYLETSSSLSNIEASRIAFSVTLFNDVIFKCYGPKDVNTTIIYKRVLLNLGGSYSVDTGIFTVPRSGVYTIAVTIYSDAGSPKRLLAACANLEVNNQAVAHSRERNRDDQEDSATIVVVLQLMAGDKVSVNLPKGCFLCEYKGYFNTFSAFLLYATV